MRIYIESNRFGHYTISNDLDDRTVYVQTDWDFPGLASTFGWVPCGECGATDGTVDCEHRTAGEMTSDAAAFLDNEPGGVEDPGYFGED